MSTSEFQIPSHMVRPPTLSPWERFKKTIWNGETKQFLGRTASSWGGILFFYVIFYAGLSALFAICMQGLFYTLNRNIPTYQGDESLIGSNPGMGFRPISKDVETAGSLIWYVASNESSVEQWTKSLDEYLAPYNATSPRNRVTCDHDTLPAQDKVCAVNINSWGPCNSENNYGFHKSQPCFFIKLNRIFGWEPVFYNDTNDLPQEMPDELKTYIKNMNDTKKRNTVWVSCHGENPADKENIGELKYYPDDHGFAGYYYPYTNKAKYLSPLVAVQLVRPTVNVLINIECRAWAKNIHYSKVKHEREGSVHLEIMID